MRGPCRDFRIAILTEGGRDRGFGHVARCHALFEALRAVGARPRMLVQGDESAAAVAPRTHCEFLDWRSRPARLKDLLRRSDAAVVDSYLAPAGFYRWLASQVPLAAFIDDNKRLAYPSGMIINGSVYAGGMGYPRGPRRRLIVGPRHILLRPPFWDPPAPPPTGKIRRVLITVGGSSARGLVSRTAKAVLDSLEDVRVHAVAGKEDLAGLRRLSAANQGRVRILGRPVSMPRALAGIDLCVSAGGQTLNELAAFGIPCVGIALAENQYRHLRAWARRGFMIAAGRPDDARFETRLRSALKRAAPLPTRRTMSRAGRGLVDGRGALRTAAAILAEIRRNRKGASS